MHLFREVWSTNPQKATVKLEEIDGEQILLITPTSTSGNFAIMATLYNGKTVLLAEPFEIV